MRKGRVSKNNKDKECNKYCSRNCCPCIDLGEHLKSRYEVVNILSDNEDSIFSPEHENTTFDYYGPRKGQLFINADSIGEKLGEAFANILKGNIKNVV